MRRGIPAGTAILRRPLDRVPPAAPLESRVARLLPGRATAEERLECAVKALDRGPLAAKGPAPVTILVLCPDLLKLRVLAVERHPVTALPPRLAPLLKR